MKLNVFKSKKGLIGITLALYYVASLITYLSTLGALVKIEVSASYYLSQNAKAYYAARAGLEHAIAIIKANPYSTLPGTDEISKGMRSYLVASDYMIGTLLKGFEIYYDARVWRACDKETAPVASYNDENTMLKYFHSDYLSDASMPSYLSSGSNIFMISSSGKVFVGGDQVAIKSLQCVYQALSTGSRVIAWRELYSVDGNKHSFLANHRPPQ
ncbi:MAG TPA: hypothetical protein PKY81_17755 [bacterium]|nr:hypothetical protein [bacterium]